MACRKNCSKNILARRRSGWETVGRRQEGEAECPEVPKLCSQSFACCGGEAFRAEQTCHARNIPVGLGGTSKSAFRDRFGRL